MQHTILAEWCDYAEAPPFPRTMFLRIHVLAIGHVKNIKVWDSLNFGELDHFDCQYLVYGVGVHLLWQLSLNIFVYASTIRNTYARGQTIQSILFFNSILNKSYAWDVLPRPTYLYVNLNHPLAAPISWKSTSSRAQIKPLWTLYQFFQHVAQTISLSRDSVHWTDEYHLSIDSPCSMYSVTLLLFFSLYLYNTTSY